MRIEMQYNGCSYYPDVAPVQVFNRDANVLNGMHMFSSPDHFLEFSQPNVESKNIEIHQTNKYSKK